MIYITGDTHGEFSRIRQFCRNMGTSREDILIILGDAGINYYGGEKDLRKKEYLSEFPVTMFCIHGNHEMRPERIKTYETILFHSGKVYAERNFPNILFAKDGEIYDFEGRKTIVLGGAYSIDKYYRLHMGLHWWEDEQPSEVIRQYAEQQLERHNWKIDIVLSHTVPLRYEPSEVFLPFIDQRNVDKSTEIWLGEIEQKLEYQKWYAGHYHTEKKIDRVEIMYQNFANWKEKI